MPRSVSVLRRYTPPTCTLEVVAKDSPLSRWAAQPVAKDLRFQLSLDDPTLPADAWTVIKGDRAQLADLCEVVSTYVQHLLEVPGTAAAPDAGGLGSTVATLPAIAPLLANAVTAENATGISLQSNGLLKHTLHWGGLANEESGAATPISTLQLFDLANALDEYAIDILDLPALDSPRWLPKVPNWAQIAALVLITIGVSTSAIRLLDQTQPLSSVASNPSQGASSSDQQIATQIPPAIVEKATPPVVSEQRLPTPSPGVPVTASPGKPTVTLPSPTPGASTAPSSGAIANYPVPIVPGQPTIIAGDPEPATQAEASAPLPSAIPNAIAGRSADSSSPANPQAFSKAPATRENAGAAPPANSTAFDSIPQVAEVRTYFQNRWNPPEGLTQTLEYSLQLDGNGTLQGITPLKQASGDYLDRTGMPLLGDPFVSPLKGRDTAKIRLVLDANGQVKAFLEE